MGVLRVDCLPVTTPRRFDLRLSFSDGSVAPAWLALPDGPAPYPAVFYAHAHGNRYETGRDELWDGRPALVRPYGPDILGLGAAVFCLEMPLFGQRRGDEAALAKAHAWRGQPRWGRMLAEAQAAFTWLAGLPSIADDRIATLGLSMGGAQAFWLGALEPRVAAVAHLCCFADMAELIHCGAHDLHGPYLTVPGLPNVTVVGDAAKVPWKDGLDVPGIAPAAKQEGKYVGRRLAALVEGKAAPKPFRYRHLGNLATIGRNSAIISLGWLKLSGFVAWCIWGVVHIYFLIGVKRPLFVAMNWVSNYLFRSKGARLITGMEGLRAIRAHIPKQG